MVCNGHIINSEDNTAATITISSMIFLKGSGNLTEQSSRTGAEQRMRMRLQ